MGRDVTLQHFAREVLEGEVEAVMLGYIEKGERLPSESLVRRLAVLREEDPRELLALLSRDRMLRALGKELRNFLPKAPAIRGVRDAELAILVSEAITGLPDDGRWVSLSDWQTAIREALPAKPTRKASGPDPVDEIQKALAAQDLIEIDADQIRRLGHHYEPQGAEQRLALATEYSVLFFEMRKWWQP